MKRSKKWIAAALALVFILAACGTGGSEPAPPEPAAAPAPAAPAPAPANAEAGADRVLSIAVFEGGFGRDFWYDKIARFEAANPGVTVSMQISPDINEIIAPQIAVGEIHDFMSVQMLGIATAMRDAQEFRDLTDFFNTTEALDRPGTLLRDIIVPGMLESTLFAPYGDGRVHMAPFNAGPMGMVYNRTLFEQMGWEPPTTWDELFAMDALLDDPATFVNIGGNYERRAIFTYQGIHPGYLESILFPAIASAVGLDGLQRVMDFEAGSWDNPGVRQVVANLARLGVDNYLMEGTVAMDHTTSQAMMMMGRALFIPNGLWFENEMADAPREEGFQFAIAPPPTLTAGQERFIMSSAEVIALPTGSPEPDLALEFLRFLYTRESTASLARLTGGNIAIIDAPEIIAPYIEPGVASMLRAYELGTFMLFGWSPLPEGFPTPMGAEVFNNNMTPLMTGVMSVDEYIARLEEVATMARGAQ